MKLLSSSFHQTPLPRTQYSTRTQTSDQATTEEDHYPTQPLFNSCADFSCFDVDTLFFVFYFQAGSPEQIRASLELKRKGWIFSKKFKTWFKRHKEEQKRPTVEVRKEVATFIYFDDSDWCKRIKDNVEMDFALVENEVVPYSH